eukprot:TRINITY_DN274_c0_g1_i1.p2 TRINITY_DN274_c0_g1~~TRINITY_DN274_c0_g1_i1.p2  ORF type:complete len:104 (-),score=10.97 TRINITY_DN274_c0_g1_i1:66-377(-)
MKICALLVILALLINLGSCMQRNRRNRNIGNRIREREYGGNGPDLWDACCLIAYRMHMANDDTDPNFFNNMRQHSNEFMMAGCRNLDGRDMYTFYLRNCRGRR